MIEIQENPLRTLLLGMKDAGAADLIVGSDQVPYYKINGDMVQASDRVVREAEIDSYLNKALGGGPSLKDAHFGQAPLNFTLSVGRDRKRQMRFRFNVTAFDGGVRPRLHLVIRQLPIAPPLPEDINVPVDIVRNVLAQPFGIGFVGGATGSGKSTTLSSMIRKVAETRCSNIITLEEPIEYIYTHTKAKTPVFQKSVGKGGNVSSFSSGVREAMRQSPDYLLVGEVRDDQTAKAIVQFSETGHYALTSIHISRATGLLDRFGSFFSQSVRESILKQMIPQINFVLVQALLKKKSGGRVAAHEYIVVDNEMKSRLLGMDVNEVRAVLNRAIDEKGTSFVESSRRLLDEGLISKQEYERFMFTIGVYT